MQVNIDVYMIMMSCECMLVLLFLRIASHT
jgi:hypothetical protein